MKIVLVFVATLDGKVTKWGDPLVTSWSSQEDKEYFMGIWNDSTILVMGSTSYRSTRFKPTEKHLLLVMTREPSKYENNTVLGQLEFTNESPALLAKRLEMEGHDQMVVVGGPHIATSFFREQLIDELWLTIEPKIFGTGGSLVTAENFDINLKLISCEKVNEQGTLITKYSVLKK